MSAADIAQIPQAVCTTSEAARRLGVSSTTVQVMVERGELAAWRTRGGHRRISLDSVESIQRQRGAGTGRGRAESSGLCVVVVEGPVSERESCAAVLRGWGWALQVMSANDGLEALLLIERRRPDIVIVDLELTGFDGAAFVRSLRAHHEFDAIQLIALTKSVEQERTLGAHSIGGVALYRKPVSTEKLQGFVEANLLRHALAGGGASLPSGTVHVPVIAQPTGESLPVSPVRKPRPAAPGKPSPSRPVRGAARQRSQGGVEAVPTP